VLRNRQPVEALVLLAKGPFDPAWIEYAKDVLMEHLVIAENYQRLPGLQLLKGAGSLQQPDAGERASHIKGSFDCSVHPLSFRLVPSDLNIKS
jgi:hypothetical protein